MTESVPRAVIMWVDVDRLSAHNTNGEIVEQLVTKCIVHLLHLNDYARVCYFINGNIRQTLSH